MQLDPSLGIGGAGKWQECTFEDAVVTDMLVIVENRAGSAQSDGPGTGASGVDG